METLKLFFKTLGCLAGIFFGIFIIVPAIVIFSLYNLSYQKFDPLPSKEVITSYYQEKGWTGTIKDVVVQNSGDARFSRRANYIYEEVVDGKVLTFRETTSVKSDTNKPYLDNYDGVLRHEMLKHNVDFQEYLNIKFELPGFTYLSNGVSPAKDYDSAEKEILKRSIHNPDKRLNGYYTAPMKDLMLNSTYKTTINYKKTVPVYKDLYDDKILEDFVSSVKQLDLSHLPNGTYLFSFTRHGIDGSSYSSVMDGVTVRVTDGKVEYPRE